MTNYMNFTKREWEIATLLNTPYKNKQIAQTLNITERTVKFHCNNLYKKLKVKNRLEFIIKIRDVN